MVNMREKEIEKYLCDQLRKKGIECVKFIPDQCSGMPDRLVLLSEGRCAWVELKTKGGRLSELQKYMHKKLQASGQKVFVVWSKENVDEFVRAITE